MAGAIRERYGSPIIHGNAKILGDPNIKVGDLIYCKIPSIELSGVTIDGNYRCNRVNHHIDVNGWSTYVDLGDLDLSPFELLVGFLVKSRVENSNNVQ